MEIRVPKIPPSLKPRIVCFSGMTGWDSFGTGHGIFTLTFTITKTKCIPGTPRSPLFLKVNPPKQGRNSNQNKGHFGFQVGILYNLLMDDMGYYESPPKKRNNPHDFLQTSDLIGVVLNIGDFSSTIFLPKISQSDV